MEKRGAESLAAGEEAVSAVNDDTSGATAADCAPPLLDEEHRVEEGGALLVFAKRVEGERRGVRDLHNLERCVARAAEKEMEEKKKKKKKNKKMTR